MAEGSRYLRRDRRLGCAQRRRNGTAQGLADRRRRRAGLVRSPLLAGTGRTAPKADPVSNFVTFDPSLLPVPTTGLDPALTPARGIFFVPGKAACGETIKSPAATRQSAGPRAAGRESRCRARETRQMARLIAERTPPVPSCGSPIQKPRSRLMPLSAKSRQQGLRRRIGQAPAAAPAPPRPSGASLVRDRCRRPPARYYHPQPRIGERLVAHDVRYQVLVGMITSVPESVRRTV
jgi:hypothetical protein